MIKLADIEKTEVENGEILQKTEEFFGKNSPLRESEKFGAPKYEDREQQKMMALKIAESFEKKENLCAEAPTGIGKSYAYLVPSVFYAKKIGLPVLISTETINLQEQLMLKDIPVLKKMIDGGFSATLAKGRSHYACLRRMRFIEERIKEELFENHILESIQQIILWISEGTSGEDTDIPFHFEKKAWDLLCCEGGNCFGPKCSHYRECFYWIARNAWDKADIVVANHALFFTGMKVADIFEYSFLPTYGALVFDEAHTIENEAAEHCGIRLNKIGFEIFLKKLYDPDKIKGLCMRGGDAEMEIRGIVPKILKLSSIYFKEIDAILQKNNSESMRFRQANFAKDILSEELFALAKILEKTGNQNEDSKQEMVSYVAKSEAYAEAFYQFTEMKLENYVYWAERDEKRSQIELFASPINVKELLNTGIFKDKCPTILTSATLSVEKSLNYYCGRVGFEGGEKIIFDTVFDYEKQMKIFISKSVPAPEDKNYLSALSAEIRRYTEKTHGKAFVLFTNHDNMRNCADNLREFYKKKNITLLVHGEGLSRNRILDQFRKDVDSVIFGATSFWSGVDVPGESLSNVIITKLPFLVPSHPLIQARSESEEKNGGNSFRNYQLPEAVLRFRQGIGRLIRTKTDFGIVVILDSRIISKSYGKTFLASIPKCEHIVE
jgi:ATP-dependent DNA helicase DinG